MVAIFSNDPLLLGTQQRSRGPQSRRVWIVERLDPGPYRVKAADTNALASGSHSRFQVQVIRAGGVCKALLFALCSTCARALFLFPRQPPDQRAQPKARSNVDRTSVEMILFCAAHKQIRSPSLSVPPHLVVLRKKSVSGSNRCRTIQQQTVSTQKICHSSDASSWKEKGNEP